MTMPAIGDRIAWTQERLNLLLDKLLLNPSIRKRLKVVHTVGPYKNQHFSNRFIKAQRSGHGYWAYFKLGRLEIWFNPHNGRVIHWFCRK